YYLKPRRLPRPISSFGRISGSSLPAAFVRQSAPKLGVREYHMTKILIPAAFTLANLACGVLAIRLAVCSHPEDAAQTLLQCGWLLIAAMVFDALDGPVARRLGVTSRIGAVLDGIADGVSFGIVPAAVLLLIWSQPSEEHLSALSPALV